MKGIEVSVFILTDGTQYLLLPEAKDYKRIGEGDTGLNTGGMGAISPVPFADDVFMQKVKTQIIEPTLNGLREENIPYFGFIFFGLMNVDGQPKVVEYNARMGDPETEVVFPRIESDVLEMFVKLSQGKLSEYKLAVSAKTAATVVLASGGYPEKFETGKNITQTENINNTLIFHAGTSFDGKNVSTSGGRVLALTSFGDNISEATEKSLQAAEKIHFDNKYYRKDIGQDLIQFTR
jgi:phosphoribosylamine--glycine ligase